MKGRTVLASRVRTVTITDPALGVSNRTAGHVLHQFAEHLRPHLTTGCIGANVGIGGQVENGREQT